MLFILLILPHSTMSSFGIYKMFYKSVRSIRTKVRVKSRGEGSVAFVTGSSTEKVIWTEGTRKLVAGYRASYKK